MIHHIMRNMQQSSKLIFGGCRVGCGGGARGDGTEDGPADIEIGGLATRAVEISESSS